MATSQATPAAMPAQNFSGMSLDSAIDSIQVPETTAPAATETPEPPPPAEAAAPEPEPESQVEETQEAAPPATEPEINDFDEIKPDREADGGKTFHFSANKTKALMAARDFRQRLQEAIPNATIEDLQDNFRRTVELDRMLTDYESGDPERVGGVLEAWVNPQANPASLMAFADMAPAKLSQAHPQAFQRLETNILANYVQRAYQEASRSGDERLLEIAQNLDYRLNGRFRQAQELQQQRDPMQAERRQFEVERRQWTQQQAQQRTQWVQQQLAVKDEAVSQALAAEIAKPLQTKGPDGKTIEDRLKALPGGGELKEFVTTRLNSAVEQAMKANPAWKAQYDLAEQRYKDNPSDKGRLEALVTMKRQFAAPVIAKQAKAVIDAVTGNFLGQNAAAHRQLQQTQDRTEPLNGGTPVQRATASQKLADLKKRGGTLEEGYAILGL